MVESANYTHIYKLRRNIVLLTKNNQVPVIELRRLLFALQDSELAIGIRFRLAGEMWQNHYLRLLNVTEKGAALNDDRSNKLIFIRDLNNVMQFELDQGFQQYQPHFHYSVILFGDTH
jgi:hypothetical protein